MHGVIILLMNQIRNIIPDSYYSFSIDYHTSKHDNKSRWQKVIRCILILNLLTWKKIFSNNKETAESINEILCIKYFYPISPKNKNICRRFNDTDHEKRNRWKTSQKSWISVKALVPLYNGIYRFPRQFISWLSSMLCVSWCLVAIERKNGGKNIRKRVCREKKKEEKMYSHTHIYIHMYTRQT